MMLSDVRLSVCRVYRT